MGARRLEIDLRAGRDWPREIVPDRVRIRREATAEGATVASPDGRVVAEVTVLPDGGLQYSLRHRGVEVIAPSRLGLDLAGQDDLAGGFALVGAHREAAERRVRLAPGKASIAVWTFAGMVYIGCE